MDWLDLLTKYWQDDLPDDMYEELTPMIDRLQSDVDQWISEHIDRVREYVAKGK